MNGGGLSGSAHDAESLRLPLFPLLGPQEPGERRAPAVQVGALGGKPPLIVSNQKIAAACRQQCGYRLDLPP